MIEFIDFSKKYGHDIIFSDTNLVLEGPKTYFILGRNGSGKTTLLKCLLGLENYNGTIKHPYSGQQGIFPIFDDIPLYLNLNGYDNLRMFTGKTYNKERIDTLQSLPRHLLKKKTQYYSLGEKKKLLMMVAMLKQPSCLVMDEIANGLDQESLEWLLSCIGELKKSCLIIATGHYFEFYEKILDALIVLGDKNILQLECGKESLYEIYGKYCRNDQT